MSVQLKKFAVEISRPVIYIVLHSALRAKDSLITDNFASTGPKKANIDFVTGHIILWSFKYNCFKESCPSFVLFFVFVCLFFFSRLNITHLTALSDETKLNCISVGLWSWPVTTKKCNMKRNLRSQFIFELGRYYIRDFIPRNQVWSIKKSRQEIKVRVSLNLKL